MLGSSQANRANAVGNFPSYLPDADPGMHGGGTYTAANTEPTLQDYENIFGPSARDIKQDLQRFKRHGRWHLPDILKGPNPWLTDRIDGLITDATNSPFTTKILPYLYKDNVDGKIKWNVWSFDEGMASRVPYESAARTLQQSKRSFSGYMVRQGMAIVLEHNFMMTPKGRENFKNQLNQLIGSIQYTNDLDVHMALILAPSYQKYMREKYFTIDKSSAQLCREFVDLFGMMQKNTNALDILIEEGKAILKTWGGPEPDFMLCNSKLTFQLTMTPEKTNYMTQGIDGVKRLRQGPDLASYRGLSIIHSRAFAMEVGQHPRDVLRRRVRVAEYYRIPPNKDNVNREFEFYNEERDTWFTLSFKDLLRYARYDENPVALGPSRNKDHVYKEYVVLDSDQKTKKESAIDMMGMLGAASGIGPVLGARMAPFQLPDTSLILFNDAFRAMQGRTNTPLQFYERNHILFSYDLGVKHIEPHNIPVWDTWVRERMKDQYRVKFGNSCLKECFKLSPFPLQRLNDKMRKKLYDDMRRIPINNVLRVPDTENIIQHEAFPNTNLWNMNYTYMLAIYESGGIPIDCLRASTTFRALDPANPGTNSEALMRALKALQLKTPIPPSPQIDIANQVLGMHKGISPNHPVFMLAPTDFNFKGLRMNVDGADVTWDVANWNRRVSDSPGTLWARSLLMTREMTDFLVGQITINSQKRRRVDVMDLVFKGIEGFEHRDFFEGLFTDGEANTILKISELDVGRIVSKMQAWFASDNVQFFGIDGVDESENSLRDGINLIPMGFCTASSIYNRINGLKKSLNQHSGLLSMGVVSDIAGSPEGLHPWTSPLTIPESILLTGAGAALMDRTDAEIEENSNKFFDTIQDRLLYSPDEYLRDKLGIRSEADRMKLFIILSDYNTSDRNALNEGSKSDVQDRDNYEYVLADRLDLVNIDMNNLTGGEPYPPKAEPNPRNKEISRPEDVEIVIVRPNIEHNMLGIIMGLGGNELGNTLWGQTELSVYDDSMHGIWGMSYKYHERAIVFNEKNLIRLWDIAYDGYNGGKDDTYVNWNAPEAPNGVNYFCESTMDVSKSYRGPSMMVMAFVHDRGAKDESGDSLFEKHFRRNWPSPIVFHDKRDAARGERARMMLPVDTENLHVIDVEEFRVFNNRLYDSYQDYYQMMPKFHEMHAVRKTAGQSSAESETPGECLAFQGSMRIKVANRVLEEIHGSGHHGPDFVGAASVRAGKGQKVAPAAPTIHRLV